MDCFVCSEYLNGDDAFVQAHLNRCLDRQGSSSSPRAGAPTLAKAACATRLSSTASSPSSSCTPLAPSCSQDEALALSLAQHDQLSFFAPLAAVPDPLEQLVCPCCQALWDDVGLAIASTAAQSDRELVEDRRKRHVMKCIEGRQTFEVSGADDDDPLQHGEYDSGEGQYAAETEFSGVAERINGKGKGKMGWNGAVGTKAEVKGTARLVPLLRQALAESQSSPHGRTLVAYLASDHVEHIGTKFGDWGWGCGYKNLQMLISSARHLPQYRELLANLTIPEGIRYHPHHDPSDSTTIPIPTILELQGIIQTAWSLGFDPPGAQHFRHRLIGKKSWIGTTEVFTALSILGIRARIVDFPKVKKGQERAGATTDGTHQTLIKWIVSYFSTPPRSANHSTSPISTEPLSFNDLAPNGAPRPPENAFTTLLSSAHRSSAVLTVSPNKQPLYLQHQGHSRTIIGIERMKAKGGGTSTTAGEGEEWLLIFDPGKPVSNDLKRLASASASTGSDPAPVAKKLKPSGFGQLSSSSSSRGVVRPGRGGGGGGGEYKFGDVLKVFRVNMKDLKKRDEYQILYVEEDGAPLTQCEKEQRKVVKATIGKSVWTRDAVRSQGDPGA